MSKERFLVARRRLLAAACCRRVERTARLGDPAKLTVMCLGGTWGNSIAEAIGKPFTAQSGASIAYDQRPNAQEVVALFAMRDHPSVDVCEVGGPIEGKTLAGGLLAPLDPAIMTNAVDILPIYKTQFIAYRLSCRSR